MAALTITRPRGPATQPIPAGGHPKAVLEAEQGARLVLPYAPRGSDLSGLADKWEVIARPGRKALVLHNGKSTPTLSLTLVLGYADHQTSIEPILAKLRELGEASERIILSNMSPQERGPWRITDLTVNATNRQQGTNHITRANATLTLTAASDALSRRGPLSGGKDGKGGKVRRYTVKRGDTLRSIAAKANIYGNPSKWKALANANDIVNARNIDKLVGRVIKVPR